MQCKTNIHVGNKGIVTSRACLDSRLLQGLDDTLLDHHTRLGASLVGFLSRPLRADGHPQRPFVLRLGLKLMRQLASHVLFVLEQKKVSLEVRLYMLRKKNIPFEYASR
jgi:hypothetical protein